jgi:hypothetical protein
MPLQLRLRVLPQLLLQPLVPRPLAPPVQHTHRLIKSTIHHLLLPHRTRPRLIQRAPHRTLIMSRQHASNQAIQPHSEFHERVRAHVVEQICQNDAGMQAYACYGWVLFGERARVQDVGEFGRPVAAPGADVFEGGLVEFDTRGGRDVMAHTAQRNDADVCTGLFGRFQHCWKQKLREERVAHVVCAELDFIAFFGCGVWGGHDSRIVDEDIETRFPRFEGVGRRGDGGEGGEVEREVDDFAGVGNGGLDGGDGGGGFGGGARGEVDARRGVRGEIGDALFA